MNPLAIIALAAMGVVGTAGIISLPPDSEDPTTFPADFPDPYADPFLEALPEPLAASETSVPVPTGYCPPVYDLALSEGFTPEEAALLDRIAFFESRCVVDIIGDRNVGDSYGILQIHTDTFCEPSTYWPSGYLQAALVLESCVELFDPAIAVKAARAIFVEYGFEAWSTYEKALGS